jgi:nucleotide-binding universal stress UspA family protein
MPPFIVPLDGSSRSEAAIPCAVAFSAGSPLLLVTTMWGTDSFAPRKYLEARAADLSGVEVDTTLVYDREAADAILLEARQHPGSIICMATHGRSGLGEAVLGSVAEAVVRVAESPVLLVGPNVEACAALASPMVIAVDDAGTADAIARAAAPFATTRRHAIRVVEVVAPPPFPFSTELEMDWSEEGSAVEAAVATLASLDLEATAEVVRDVDPARGIVDFAEHVPASLIVVGTHARHGLARVALGSVAMQVVHRSRCPVLVIRP